MLDFFDFAAPGAAIPGIRRPLTDMITAVCEGSYTKRENALAQSSEYRPAPRENRVIRPMDTGRVVLATLMCRGYCL